MAFDIIDISILLITIVIFILDIYYHFSGQCILGLFDIIIRILLALGITFDILKRGFEKF